MQSLTYLRTDSERLIADNARLKAVWEKTKIEVNSVISERLDENETADMDAAKLFNEFIQREKETAADLDRVDRSCQKILRQWQDSHEEKDRAYTKFSYDFHVLMEFKKTEEEFPLRIQERIDAVIGEKERKEQEAARIVDYLYEKSTREMSEIESKMMLKVEKLGQGMGKMLSKRTKISTPLTLTQRDNKRVRKEIEIHSGILSPFLPFSKPAGTQ